MKSCLLFMIMLFSMVITANSQVSTENISGKWTGTLSAPDATLRIVVNLIHHSDGNYTATMESPDQTTMVFPVQKVSLETIHSCWMLRLSPGNTKLLSLPKQVWMDSGINTD